jgi:hypothetical protein
VRKRKKEDFSRRSGVYTIDEEFRKKPKKQVVEER